MNVAHQQQERQPSEILYLSIDVSLILQSQYGSGVEMGLHCFLLARVNRLR